MLSCPILDYLSTYGKINPQNSKTDNEKCLPTAVQRKDTYIMGAIVTLKKGEGRLLKSGGAWIFDNEVDTIVGSFENGDIVIVKDFDGYPLGKGFINTNSKIFIRMLTRHVDTEIDEAFFAKRLQDAWDYRKKTVDTSSCRVVFGEADFLPGIVIDKFENVLVVESLALGIEAINKSTWSEKWAEYRKRPGSFIMFILVHLATLITVLSIGFLLVYVLVKGIPNLNADIFSWEYTSDNCSLVPALINTVYMTLLSLLIAGPIGIFAAIYLVEYAKTGNKLVGVVRITAETLTGIPSIVYGLFGMLFFTNACGLRLSLISGALTLAIMVLPVIMRTTEEALMAVPKSYREGSFGLGAGKLRTVFKVVLPSAVPGILSGIILATGRIVGETAALIYTAGSVAKMATKLTDSTRTLAVHMYLLSKEGLHTDQGYATAVVLLVLVVLINFASDKIAGKVAADKAN